MTFRYENWKSILLKYSIIEIQILLYVLIQPYVTIIARAYCKLMLTKR